MDPFGEGNSVAARAPITPTGEVMGGGGAVTKSPDQLVERAAARLDARVGQENSMTGAEASAHLEALASTQGTNAAITEAATSSVLLPPGSVDLRAGVVPGTESAAAATPPPVETHSTKRQREVEELQARRDSLNPDEDGRLKQLVAEQQEQKLLTEQEASGRPLTEAQKTRLQELNSGVKPPVEAPKAPTPADEAMERAASRLDPKIEAEAKAKAEAVKPDSKTEFDDLQARKDSLTPEEKARRDNMIAQQQERTLLLKQQEAGTPLTDIQEARLKELNGAWGEAEESTNEAEKKLTPEQRTAEMTALREKAKGEGLTDEEKGKLQQLENDEIEALTQEYNPEDSESLLSTSQKLEAIAESRRGYAENAEMKAVFAKVFKEWAEKHAKPDANLNEAQKAAVEKVRNLIGEMHKDLLTIINADRLIARAQKEADKAMKETKAQEAKVSKYKDISNKKPEQAEEVQKLETMYVNLLNKKAQLLGAANASRLANNAFRIKRAQVRRSLGVTGFWGSLIESTVVASRNKVGNGVAAIDTFLNGKPLAERYVQNGYKNFPLTG
jgi:hypothetical protein